MNSKEKLEQCLFRNIPDRVYRSGCHNYKRRNPKLWINNIRPTYKKIQGSYKLLFTGCLAKLTFNKLNTEKSAFRNIDAALNLNFSIN